MGIKLTGGVYLPKNKLIKSVTEIKQIAEPTFFSVPITCTHGMPAEPVVQKGDYVKEGTLIAKPTGTKGAFVYSPTSGNVVDIIDKFTPGGKRCKHVVINSDGKHARKLLPEIKEFSAKELLRRLAVSGIVDANFGGTPSYLRYSLSAVERQYTLYVVLGGTDPYLQANQALANLNMEQVVHGAKYFAQILASKKIVFITTFGQRKLRNKLKAYMSEHEPKLKYQIKQISSAYPAESYELLMKKFSPRKNIFVEKLHNKVFIEDAITCCSFCAAVESNIPCYYRTITICGSNVKNSGVYTVKNGVTFEHILKEVGFDNTDGNIKMLNGGIMAGLAQYSDQVSVNPETNSIVFVPCDKQNLMDEKPCINCGKCVAVCPMNILPNQLDELCVIGKHHDCKKMGITSCIGCGCCSYVCPSRRYLAQRISSTKQQIKEGKY